MTLSREFIKTGALAAFLTFAPLQDNKAERPESANDNNAKITLSSGLLENSREKNLTAANFSDAVSGSPEVTRAPEISYSEYPHNSNIFMNFTDCPAVQKKPRRKQKR